MARRYKSQEKGYSCGASAIRNLLIHFKLAEVTEGTVRKVCGTTKCGTTEAGLLDACSYYGLEAKEWESISATVFKRRITKALKEGKALILNSDALDHWIVALEYHNKRVRIIDSMFKVNRKSIDQWVTLKQLAEMCDCYDRERERKYFYCIETWLN